MSNKMKRESGQWNIIDNIYHECDMQRYGMLSKQFDSTAMPYRRYWW